METRKYHVYHCFIYLNEEEIQRLHSHNNNNKQIQSRVRYTREMKYVALNGGTITTNKTLGRVIEKKKVKGGQSTKRRVSEAVVPSLRTSTLVDNSNIVEFKLNGIRNGKPKAADRCHGQWTLQLLKLHGFLHLYSDVPSCMILCGGHSGRAQMTGYNLSLYTKAFNGDMTTLILMSQVDSSQLYFINPKGSVFNHLKGQVGVNTIITKLFRVAEFSKDLDREYALFSTVLKVPSKLGRLTEKEYELIENMTLLLNEEG
jgi:hypothetical protein